MLNDIKKIGVLTSGGDAPGMNAAVRAVVRTAEYYNIQVEGIYHGYKGMVENNIKPLSTSDVGNIIQRGGTILKTARSEKFRSSEGREKAHRNLKELNIDACIVIGGDGSYTGAKVFTEEYQDIPFIGLPGTIDNDIFGTDFTIGFDTAVNTAMEAIDKIRDTGSSHDRLFFIEVMGRHAGHIALYTGLGSGASTIFMPETITSIDVLVDKLIKSSERNKMFNMVVVAEGNENGNAMEISDQVKKKYGFESRVTILGHLQRGGSPSAIDRVLATRLGYSAVKCIMEGDRNTALGIVNDSLEKTNFSDAINKKKDMNNDLLDMANILSL
ncbi:MAG: 6-phosphofructokinase [Saprospiraceae bacterium]